MGHSSSTVFYPIIEMVKVASAPVFKANAVGVERNANNPMDTETKLEPLVALAETLFKTLSRVSFVFFLLLPQNVRLHQT